MKAWEVIGFTTTEGEVVCIDCGTALELCDLFDDAPCDDIKPIFASDNDVEQRCHRCGEHLIG